MTEHIITLLTPAALIVFVVAQLYSNWRSGAKNISSEVMQNYKTLDEQQKERIVDLQSSLQKSQEDITEIKQAMRTMEKDYNKQISELRGQLTEKDRHIKELQDTIALRNPEFLAVLNSIKEFMERLDQKANESKTVLDKQTKMMENQ